MPSSFTFMIQQFFQNVHLYTFDSQGFLFFKTLSFKNTLVLEMYSICLAQLRATEVCQLAIQANVLVPPRNTQSQKVNHSNPKKKNLGKNANIQSHFKTPTLKKMQVEIQCNDQHLEQSKNIIKITFSRINCSFKYSLPKENCIAIYEKSDFFWWVMLGGKKKKDSHLIQLFSGSQKYYQDLTY